MSTFASEMFRSTSKVAGKNPGYTIRTTDKQITASVEANVFADDALEVGDYISENNLTGKASEKSAGGRAKNKNEFVSNGLARVVVAIHDEGKTLTAEEIRDRYQLDSDGTVADVLATTPPAKKVKKGKRPEVSAALGENGEQTS